MNTISPIIILTFMLFGCKDNKKIKQNVETSKVDNIESFTLPTEIEVKIGNQVWMTQNLNVDKFLNGDSIPQATNNSAWIHAAQQMKPIWAYYDYDETNGKKYGKLYNFYAVKDNRKIALKGWHVPTAVEFKQLIDALGGEKIAGKKIKSSNGWSENGNGTNESGFYGIPGGTLHFLGGGQGALIMARWWSSSLINKDQANALGVDNNMNEAIIWNPRLDYGFSVRLIKD